VTTFLSTLHLLAQSDVQSTRAYRGAEGTRQELGGDRSRQSRTGSPKIAVDHDGCPKDPPQQLGPGDDDKGKIQVPNPVTFRWTAVANAATYRVVYSVEKGVKDVVLGTTAATELTGSVPAGLIKWKVFAVGASGCDTHSKELKFTSDGNVCAPPSIAMQPQPQNITAGESATLSVAANGSGPLTYQWYAGNTPVGTNSTTLNTGVLTKTSTYTVIVTNACGSVTSSAATVTVTQSCEPPSIATQPQSQTVSAGSSATLSVIANGTAPLSYQWFAGSTPVGTNNSILNTGALAQTTTYTVVVSNACGSMTSSSATVNVCAPPSIAMQPQSRNVTAGQSVTLTVSANGTAPLSYQWFAGSTPVGTNSSALNTGALTQTTTYTVAVTNACGTATSSAATINVTPSCMPPSIVTAPSSQTLDEGASATLTVVANGTAPLTYQWYESNTPVGTNSSTFNTGALAHTTHYHVVVTNACGSVQSETASVTVRPNPSQGCRGVDNAPSVSAIATVTSGVEYNVRWSAVDNASAYDIEEAAAPSFDNASAHRIEGLNASFGRVVTAPISRYYRVRGVNDCNAGRGAWSAPVRVAIVPPRGSSSTTDLIAPHGARGKLQSVVTVQVEPGATSYVASASEVWMSVEPASGGVPPSGLLTLTVTVDPASLPHGTSMATLRVVTTGGASRGIGTNDGGSVALPISVSLVTPVMPVDDEASNDVVVIPAVAHADGNNSRWQSDVRIAHTYPQTVLYDLTFTPSGASRDEAMQTQIAIPPAQTIALDDVLGRWFGAGMATTGMTGVLEVRALDVVHGTGRTLATSRLFNVTANGSFGQFLSGVPLSRFSANHAQQALIALAQSSAYRTNLGIVEGSGRATRVLLEAFDGGGMKLFESTLNLGAHQHQQINSLLAANGIDIANARVSVSVLSGGGSVYSFASVIDNTTGDPSFIPPVAVDGPRARRTTIAGVANLPSGNGMWQTDVRLFNSNPADVTATLEFFRQGESEPAATRELTIAAGETRALDDVLQSLFGMTGAGGALRITTAVDSALAASARTYHRRENNSTYGQYIAGATDSDAVGLGDAPLQILQVEESSRFRTNVGFSEVSGAETTVEVSVSLPGKKQSAVTQVTLRPNEYRQLNSLLASMGMQDAYNAQVTVRVVGGAGRVIAYGSVIDTITQDPTYVMAQ
jgi:hypothetical protein